MLFTRKAKDMPTADTALPGRAEAMPVQERHLVLGTPIAPPFPESTEQAVLGMGCFWGAERIFWQAPGVYTTAVGYAGGITPNPTYEEVCSGRTGHAEVVLVVFDPEQISYEQVLRIFWEGPRPDAGHAPGQRRRHAVPLRDLLDDRGATRAAEASRERFQQELTAPATGRSRPRSPTPARSTTPRRTTSSTSPEPERLLRSRRDRRHLPGRPGDDRRLNQGYAAPVPTGVVRSTSRPVVRRCATYTGMIVRTITNSAITFTTGQVLTLPDLPEDEQRQRVLRAGGEVGDDDLVPGERERQQPPGDERCARPGTSRSGRSASRPRRVRRRLEVGARGPAQAGEHVVEHDHDAERRVADHDRPELSCTDQKVKNEFSAIPVMIPGNAIGSTNRNEIDVLPEEPVTSEHERRQGAEDAGRRPSRPAPPSPRATARPAPPRRARLV